VILARAHGARDHRACAVRADDDARFFRDWLAASIAPAYAVDAPVLHRNLFDAERFAHFRASFSGSINENLVEQDAARAIAFADARERRRRAYEREVSEVESRLRDGRAVARGDFVEQAPAFEMCDARLVYVVAGDGVAGKRRPVYDEYLVTLAREQHRQGRTRATRSDDNSVVHASHPSFSQTAFNTLTNARIIGPFQSYRARFFGPEAGAGKLRRGE
jgi:hypothetical protein